MAPRDAAGGIVVHEGKIALVWQNGNSWSFPKGGIDKGESPLEAAWREIKEEIGLRPPTLQLVGELDAYVRRSIGRDGKSEDMSRPPSTRTLFLFTSSSEVLAPEDAEVSEARFVSVDEALALLTHPKDKEFLQSVRSKIEAL